jgi:acetyl-CoA carboxylase biotin carboxyl carrier protein
MDLDLEELAAVIELLDKADFTDFRYEKGDLRIAVRRGGPPLDEQPARSAPAPSVISETAQAPTAPQRARVASPSPRDVVAEEGTVLVRASMLGTFYRSPKPGDAPFVEIGDKVDPDSVVCIVEVMKLMNSVSAGVSGEIVAVHAQNGDLVEFDQPLFSVRPIS